MDPEYREMLLDSSPEELVERIAELEDDLAYHLRLPPLLAQRYGHLDRAELARRLEICERSHHHWIHMTVQAVMGKINLQWLTDHAFRLMTSSEIPPVNVSQDALAALLDEIERLDSLEAKHGPLRSIVLDN